MKEKKVEERAAAPSGEKPVPAKRKTGKAAGGSEESGGKTQRAGTAEAPGPSPEGR